MDIEVKIVKTRLKIYFDKIIHISIPVEKIEGFQSYKGNVYFVLEFYTTNQIITREYDLEDKWLKVLSKLYELYL